MGGFQRALVGCADLRLGPGDRSIKPDRAKHDSVVTICTERRLTNAVIDDIFCSSLFEKSVILWG